MNNLWLVGIFLSLFTIVGCEKDCACSGVAQASFCVTANGSRFLPDSLIYIREEETNQNKFDTLNLERSHNCFLGYSGKFRVQVKSGDSLVYRSDWVQVDATGCCHIAETKIVDLPL
jgi:hypothetical protein